ncbi:MAG: hypothetical protein M3N37_05935, partial [Actinomycetota bacterium]|nr:hypothetical protein [Actinomycetota bacterium]
PRASVALYVAGVGAPVSGSLQSPDVRRGDATSQDLSTLRALPELERIPRNHALPFFMGSRSLDRCGR